MPEYGPQDRRLFETIATELYQDAVATGALRADDPRLAPGSESRPAFDLLVQLNLLMLDGATHSYVPVDPATVESRIVAPLGQRGAELLTESSEWAKAFGTLSQSWRRSPQSSRGPFTELQGPEAIQSFIAAAVADAQEELLTAQPQTARASANLGTALNQAAQRESAALDRGVRMRTLYQHSARRNAMTHKYVATVTAHGAEVRTLDEFFNRIIVVDRRLAIIPGKNDLAVALAIREPNMVAYLVDMFERTWERARPFTSKESSLMQDIAAEQRAMTIRMLIEGHADPVSAKRLGVSARTYAGYVADLKEEFEAETRFQLGYTLGQRGVSGNEADAER